MSSQAIVSWCTLSLVESGFAWRNSSLLEEPQ